MSAARKRNRSMTASNGHAPKRFAETRSHTFMCVQRVSGALPLTSRGQFSRRRKLPEKQSGYLFALLATFSPVLRSDASCASLHAELEDEEEEAAPTSEKRLKREIRAEALRRLEEAARTESDFLTVVDEWNKLDRNRERRERDHENLRGDVPLEFQAVPDPKIAPLWMNLPRFRQLCQGNFLDIIFSCPYELHELTANRFLSKLFFTLSDEQKEVLYYLFVKQYSTTRLATIRGQSDRNIRKLRMTIQKKLQRRMYEHLSEKLENDHGLTLREREFVEEYEALLQTMGKNAVIRRENKTKPRKKKAALDDAKDG